MSCQSRNPSQKSVPLLCRYCAVDFSNHCPTTQQRPVVLPVSVVELRAATLVEGVVVVDRAVAKQPIIWIIDHRLEFVEVVVHGVEALTKDKMGQGPADVAEENGHGEAASLIRDWK